MDLPPRPPARCVCQALRTPVPAPRDTTESAGKRRRRDSLPQGSVSGPRGRWLPGPSSLPTPPPYTPSVRGHQTPVHPAEESAQPAARGYPTTGRGAPHRHHLEAGPCRGEKRRLPDSPDGTPRFVLIAPRSQLDRRHRDPAAPPLLRLGVRASRGRTHLLDVRDVHQLDDFVPLGEAGLGAFEAQVTTGGRGQGWTEHSPAGEPEGTVPGGCSHSPDTGPLTCRDALASYNRFHLYRVSQLLGFKPHCSTLNPIHVPVT